MTERIQIYKCLVCGIVVEVLDGGAGELVCCGQLMQRCHAWTEDAAVEKHVPVVESEAGGVRVRVGKAGGHPMAPKHYIQWIEVLAGDNAYRQFLWPGQPPEARFPVSGEGIVAREFCNIHGLWKGEQR